MATPYSSGGQSPTSLSRTIERVFEDAQHTGEITLSGRKLREYPKIAPKYDLADTIHTDLSKNRFSEIPREVCEYTSMEKLNCYHNVIKVIPEAIVQLQALTHLNISRNQLSTIPPFISQIQTLEVLIANHNRLVSLPEEIGILDRLMSLDVSCNEISHLPTQIGDLKSLRLLNVRRNLLIELPLEISKLNLRRLDFSSNKISCIPTVFRKIETLDEIILDHNPLTLPPAHICTKGKQHIMKFLQLEAIKEDRKRGVLNEAEMKRLVRKSLPPQQSISSEEFRNMMDSPENKWKRHTVLSSDSGYSTTDSIEKCGWSPSDAPQANGDLEELSNLALRTGEVVKDHRTGRDRKILGHLGMEMRSPMDNRPPPLVNHNLDHNAINPTVSPETPTPTQGHFQYSPTPLSNHHATNSNSNSSVTSPQSPCVSVANSTPYNPDDITRELQRQKSEYERKKKQAEQLRLQQEEEEKEQRRRAALRLQEEQRLLLDQKREEMRLHDEANKRHMEEMRQQEIQRAEEARKREEARLFEEARQREELRKAAEEQKLREEARLREELKKKVVSGGKEKEESPKVETKKEKPRVRTTQSAASLSYGFYSGRHDNSYSYRYEDSYLPDTYSMQYRKPALSSNSFKDESKKTPNTTSQYRRTVSDSSKTLQNSSHPPGTSRSNVLKNGPSNPRNPASSSNPSTPLVSPSPSPRSSMGSAGPSPASSTSSINKAGESKSTSSVIRRPKTSDRVASSAPGSRATTPSERRTVTTPTGSRATTPRTPTANSISTSSARKNHISAEEESRQKQQSQRTHPNPETQKAKSSRLEDNRFRPHETTNNYLSKRTTTEEDKKKSTSSLSSRTHLSSSNISKRTENNRDNRDQM
ncbi:hypothetical protein KUTeg_012368 [Tegillarca granosa]|uniref:Uncharacterized protein n=1 Tax=Tegillarca granosa TaxID=220873 RepID=A0ABQ9EZC0_TEGGR|nr:hypothetical protein KUTeg_012368 [Tegillarca granosa]